MNISFCLVLTRGGIYVSKEAVGLGFALHAGLKVGHLDKPRASLCLLEVSFLLCLICHMYSPYKKAIFILTSST